MFTYNRDIRIFYYLNLLFFGFYFYYLLSDDILILELESKYYLSHLLFMLLIFYNHYNIKDEGIKFYGVNFIAVFLETISLLLLDEFSLYITLKVYFTLAEFFYFSHYFGEDTSLDVW